MFLLEIEFLSFLELRDNQLISLSPHSRTDQGPIQGPEG